MDFLCNIMDALMIGQGLWEALTTKKEEEKEIDKYEEAALEAKKMYDAIIKVNSNG